MMRPLLAVFVAAGGVIALPAVAAPDWSHPKIINVAVTEDIFAPSHLVFQAGVVYCLHIEN